MEIDAYETHSESCALCTSYTCYMDIVSQCVSKVGLWHLPWASGEGEIVNEGGGFGVHPENMEIGA